MIPRLCFDLLLKQRRTKKISILIGPRQVGKTTLLKQLHKTWGGLFLDIDIFSNYEKISTYENFINTLKINGYSENQAEMFFIFLDEFQHYEDLTKIMKNIYDHHDNIKIFASGSSSLTIKNNIQESLAGRKIVTHIYPLNFEEFLRFKNKEELIEKGKNLTRIQSKEYHKLVPELFKELDEFLIFGGYPDVVLNPPNEKQEVLKNILDLYISKDLVDYLKVEKIRNCKLLMQSLAINHGGLTNHADLARLVALDTKTVANYIEILKESFLLLVLPPYFTNKNKEISKMPKTYFLDNGVRNYFCNNFNEPSKRADSGALFESFCISEIIKNGESIEHLKYYRTKLGSEVDLIIEKGNGLIPIEFKYSKILKSSDSRSLIHFIEERGLDKAYLVNLSEIDRLGKIQKRDCFNLQFI
ncbi:MAG: hypothetical protein ACD_28C00113G0006 [uncultured bacterium]|nr:MAG: hypothetical protein ACD_28C00113G0006 [uncultured bacterium]KKT74834.1 MAG: hypothetical protein UW70_C0044G0004 [Candidatus Peregrinibacteria bacterium GW2011_GWA2_44_7]